MSIRYAVAIGITCAWLGAGRSAVAAEEPGPTLDVGSVVVTATRQPEPREGIPAQVTVITRAEIERSNATHVGDLLRGEAGLWVTNSSGSTPTGIVVEARGFNNGGGNGGRMLVLIDGRRANLADSSNPDWATIPVDTIERIEIVRGSSSALYGDNAIAGVVNVITRDGAHTESQLALTGGSYDYRKRTATLAGKDAGLSYYLYGGYDSAEGFRDNSDYRASNYVGQFGYKASDTTTIRFRSSYLGNDRLLPGTLTDDEIHAVGRRGSVADRDRGEVHQALFDLGLESNLDREHWIELTAGQTRRASGSRITIPDAGASDLHDDTRSTTVTGRYRIESAAPTGPVRLTFGADLLKERVASGSLNNFPDPMFPFIQAERTNYERRLIGLYAHQEVTVGAVWTAAIAGRMDWSNFQFDRRDEDLVTGGISKLSGDRSFRLWSPKVGLTYRLTPAARLFGSWSRGVRFPNRDELTGFFGFTPGLDPEQATTTELGAGLRLGPAAELNLTLFRMRVRDEILFVPPAAGAFDFGRNENIPEVRHQGAELSSLLQAGDGVRMKGSYTFTATKITDGPFAGGRLPVTPRHAAAAELDWGGRNGWLLALTGRAVGRRILVNDLGNSAPRLGGYSTLDTRIAYRAKTLEAFVGINNLFNRRYDETGGLGGFPFGSRVGFNPAPGRNLITGATVTF